MVKSSQISQWTVFHLSCEWGRLEETEDKTKTTNLEAPAAPHITGKSGVCVCVCVVCLWCVCPFRAAGV